MDNQISPSQDSQDGQDGQHSQTGQPNHDGQPDQPIGSRLRATHGVIQKNLTGCTNRHIYVTPFRTHLSEPKRSNAEPFVIKIGAKFEASVIETLKYFLTNMDQRVVQICFHKHNVLCTDAECNHESYSFTSTADCVDHFVSCIPDDDSVSDRSDDDQSDDDQSDDDQSDDDQSDDDQSDSDFYLNMPDPNLLLPEPQHLTPHTFSTNPVTQAMAQHLYNFGEFDALRQLLERDIH